MSKKVHLGLLCGVVSKRQAFVRGPGRTRKLCWLVERVFLLEMRCGLKSKSTYAEGSNAEMRSLFAGIGKD